MIVHRKIPECHAEEVGFELLPDRDKGDAKGRQSQGGKGSARTGPAGVERSGWGSRRATGCGQVRLRLTAYAYDWLWPWSPGFAYSCFCERRSK